MKIRFEKDKFYIDFNSNVDAKKAYDVLSGEKLDGKKPKLRILGPKKQKPERQQTFDMQQKLVEATEKIARMEALISSKVTSDETSEILS